MNTAEWFKTHKQEAIIGGGGLVVALALYVKSRNASASSSSSTPSSTVVPAVSDTTGTDEFSGVEDQILGLQSAVLGMAAAGSAPPSTGALSPGTIPAPVPASPAPSAPTGPGYGTQSFGGASYVDLGYLASSSAPGFASFGGYNVGGGAPVFFDEPGSASLLTNLSPEQVAGLPAGTELLTPTAYAGSVASTAVTGEQIK